MVGTRGMKRKADAAANDEESTGQPSAPKNTKKPQKQKTATKKKVAAATSNSNASISKAPAAPQEQMKDRLLPAAKLSRAASPLEEKARSLGNDPKNHNRPRTAEDGPVLPSTAAANLNAGGDYEQQLNAFHQRLIQLMGAAARSEAWYMTDQWRQWYSNIKRNEGRHVLYKNVVAHFKTARVYYLQDFVAPSEISRFLAAIPAVCESGDSYFELISSFKAPDSGAYNAADWHKFKKQPTAAEVAKSARTGWMREPAKSKASQQVYNNLGAAVEACPQLLNTFERRRARMKCIASCVDLFAHGGYGMSLVKHGVEKIRRNVIVVTGFGPCFCRHYLDYADLVFTEDDYPRRLDAFNNLGQLPKTWATAKRIAQKDTKELKKDKTHKETFSLLSKNRIFHVAGYLQTMKDSFLLWLRAFDDQVRLRNDSRKGYLRLIAIGTDAFAQLPDGKQKNFDKKLQGLLVRAVEEVLETNYFYYIARIGFCSSKNSHFDPNCDNKQHITLSTDYKDICYFDDADYKDYVCGLLNPGNAFSLPGNAVGYTSVESAIGENTTLRIIQSWINNKGLVDPRNHIAVDGHDMLIDGHQTSVKVPCIIGSAQDAAYYSWDGSLEELRTETIALEEQP